MSDFEQIPYDYELPFEGLEFVDNPEPRCACILLLDKSGSMSGKPIRELNDGLKVFQQELVRDSLAAKRVEVCVIEFGPVNTVVDWVGAEGFDAPVLSTSGSTPMGEAVELAVRKVVERKQTYRENGVQYYRPWIFMITDGGPTDSIVRARELVAAGERESQFSFFAVGTGDANYERLGELAVREPLKLNELRFADLFVWLSSSLRSVSHSTPGDSVPLELPTGPKGWASI